MQVIATKQHSIYTSDDCLSELGKITAGYSRLFILADENSRKHGLKIIRPHLPPFQIISIKSGEKNKNLRTCEKIWKELSKQHADRRSVLINLGGGVITDMGGFCASAYKRGIDFINIPTTLLAQVDASAGGKTGIDFLGYKNQVGTFAFPKAVLVNPAFLKTLKKRELISGFAEMIKHGLIADRSYWNELQQCNPASAPPDTSLIARSIEIKNRITTEDPFESGLRKTLNFGHTIGHAVESASLKSRNPLLHGEAVAIGILCESYLSRKMLGLGSDELDEITSCIQRTCSLQPVKAPFKQLASWMKQDKKNRSAEINFTLLRSIGKAEVNHSCPEMLIEESLQFYAGLLDRK